MKILFIAPLPPPTHGQSLAADVLFQALRKRHEVRVVNMTKPTPKNAWERVRRSVVVLGFLSAVAKKKRGADVIYLTVSESTLGNLKDLCIYILCRNALDRMFIHMLGGAGMQRILKRRGIQYRLNRFFISRMRGVIVEGRMQAATFAAVASADKIHIRNNFAEEFLFFSEAEVRQKFTGLEPLNVLFLSNLYAGKGHNELADGYLSLPQGVRNRFRITFVGGFESSRDRNDFLTKIGDDPGLSYIGTFIAGSEKRALYGKSHIFCLPTYYPFEGQPISILEAYATGCVVVTTEHSGIPEVFQDRVNGFAVETRSSASIRRVLEQIAQDSTGLVQMALANRNVAYDRYRTATYQSALTSMLEGSVS